MVVISDENKKDLRTKNEITELQNLKIIKNYLSDLDWLLCEALVVILHPFYEIQTIIEGTDYITLSFVPYFSWQIKEIIKKITLFNCSNNPIIIASIRECGEAMKEKYEERWGKVDEGFCVVCETYRIGYRQIKVGLSFLHILAAALDPRTKGLAGIPSNEYEKAVHLLENHAFKYNWSEREE